MKICRFIHNQKTSFGVVRGERITTFDSLESLIKSNGVSDSSADLDKSDVQLLPLTVPSKIVCVGRNYAEHAAELGNNVPEEPLLFLKAPSSIITDGAEIEIPTQSSKVEHEAELGVIIGRDCKNLIDEDNPFDFILGYVCLNDVTARDLQKKDVQFTRAKSFDTFCPISSLVETELDVSDVSITTTVSGELKQNGRTSQMIFSVPFLLRYISNQMTLKAGDIIATGTPAGVSTLNPGDICRIEIEGIGVLRNTVKR